MRRGKKKGLSISEGKCKTLKGVKICHLGADKFMVSLIPPKQRGKKKRRGKR